MDSYFLAQKYLTRSGWLESRFRGVSIDGNKQPIPWFTYPSVSFLSSRMKKDFRLFEFGSGNSTLWFAQRVKSIVSVENDAGYYDYMKDRINACGNVDYRYAEIGVNYNQQILEFENEFDIIVIDGRERVKCCINSFKALKKDGVIIWDNSDRQEYAEGYELLKQNNFKQIEFKGHGPITHEEWCTTIYYRDENCLGI